MKRALLLLAAIFALAGVFYTLWAGSLERRAAEKRPPERGRPAERAVTVEAAAVRIGTLEEKLSYAGSLAPLSLVDVYAKVEGRLEAVNAAVGDSVTQGQLLGRIERAEILEEVKEAEAALKVAQATVKGKRAEANNLKRQLERAERLFKRDFIARQELDAVETQHATTQAETELAMAQVAQRQAILESIRLRLRYTDIHAPISGYVAQTFLDRGAMVRTNAPILSLVDIDRVKTVIAVVEKDYRKMRPGLEAEVAVDAYPDRTFEGTIARVAPVLDPETRTAEVEIEVANPERLLKPGMFARVAMGTGRRANVLFVPDAALVKTGQRYGVYKLTGHSDSTVKLVPVATGISRDGRTEVRGAIKPGDRVVTVGNSLLRDGQEVRVVDNRTGSGRKKST